MIKIDERYCIFPKPGPYGLYIYFEPAAEGEDDSYIRIMSVHKYKGQVFPNKSPVSETTLATINKTKKMNRQIRFLTRMAPELITKLAALLAEYEGSTVIQEDPVVKQVGERGKEKAMEEDLGKYSEFK